MMNFRKFFTPIRAYSSRKQQKPIQYVKNYPNPGIDNRLKMYQDDELSAEISSSHEFEDLSEDVDHYESDFMNAGGAHKMHERELSIRKIKLKNQINYSKYVKEVEPSFLTFAEKEEIKSLHENNPNEWSIEKLSESFPALPHTIKKVLHAKWTPKSVERVLQYDDKVIRNWEAFRAGDLMLDPRMKKHLQKFQERKIILTNREELAKQFVPPKMEFPKPKSQLFTHIAETYLMPGLDAKDISPDKDTDIDVNEEFGNKNTVSESKEDFTNNDTDFQYNKERDYINFKEVQSFKIQDKEQNTEIVSLSNKRNEISLFSQNMKKNNHKNNNESMTFDEFLKKNVGRTENSTSPEDIVLKETYKKHIEKIIMFESKPTADYLTKPKNEEIVVEKNHSSLKEEDEDSKLPVAKENSQIDQILRSENDDLSSNLNASALDTHVKEWHKKSFDDEIPEFINIPKHRYKEGMTYRVKDCYYDDDGELLYRVPGLYN